LRRWNRPGQNGQVPATHNERRRGQRPGAAIKYLRRAANYTRTAPRIPAWAPRSSTCDAQRAAPWATAGHNNQVLATRNELDTKGTASNGLGVAIKYFRCTASCPAGKGLGTAINYLRGAAGYGLGYTIKYRAAPRAAALALRFNYQRRTTSSAAGNGRAQRPSSCDAQRAASRATALAPRPSILRRRGQRPGHHNQVLAIHNDRRHEQRTRHHDREPAALNERRRKPRPGRLDQVPATHNERRRGLRPRHHDQVPTTHNDRRRRQRTWHHDQEPAAHNEKRCAGLFVTIKYLRRTKSGAESYGLGITIKYLGGAAGIDLGTAIKYLRRTTGSAAGKSPGTTSNYLRYAAGIGLATKIKYPAAPRETIWAPRSSTCDARRAVPPAKAWAPR
jgi:hypothetical protein